MRERDSKRPFITDKAGQTSPATGVTDLMKKRTDDGSLDIDVIVIERVRSELGAQS